MIDAARRAQIIVLLETRDDHLPQPVRRDHSSAGFVHEPQTRTCPDCLANGRVMFGCETCGGDGEVIDIKNVALPDALPDDGASKDPYATEKPQPYGLDATRHDRSYARNAELQRLQQQTRTFKTAKDELADANRHPYGWEIMRDRKWRDYDYAALDIALELLRDHDQGAYHMLHAVYVYGWLETSAAMEHAVERGLVFVDGRMPTPIRAPGVAADPALAKDSLAYGKRPEHEAARERRRQRVLRAHLDWGWSTEQIAQHESLTRRRVQQLITEHNAHAGGDATVASGPAA